MNVVFAGTPEFALPSLEALVDHPRASLVAVYTQPDRPAGRGRKLTPSPVKRRAEQLGVPVLQPESLRSAAAVAELSALEPVLMVVTAYGLILPPAILAVPRLGCVNVHASLLPRWRGAAPIQRAIAAGDAVTGATLMQMDAGLDSGPMLAQVETPISPEDTGGSLHDRLAGMGGRLLGENLDAIFDESLAPIPQEASGVTYADKLSREEASLDWNEDSAAITRRVRAFNPWPVVETRRAGERLRLLMADTCEYDSGAAAPGTVLAADGDGIVVACGAGAVRLTRLQKAGGRPLSARDYLNGNPLSAGERLG